ncbi:S8/S53 family peptidase [Flavobacterium terrisoli]|uniref:S8/S53 family peptidase n=1 Tax=Flavobacterium terrisoli TaxID=3242195 RepID=UPI002542D8FC|nr:S8/S53 family peptidase [Flavobacterium buctense]
MKSISNFSGTNQSPVLILFFCFISLFSVAQNDTSKAKKERDLLEYEKKQQDAVARFVKLGYKRIIETPNGDYSELVGENEVGQPMYFLTGNNSNVVSGLKANILHAGFDGVILDGNGLRIGLWENGSPRTAHEMFRLNIPPALLQSRIEYASDQNSTTIQRHATHVAGTIIGNQFSPSLTSPLNSLVRGVSFRSTIKAWDWLNVPAEMQTAATTDNIKIANTSFGLNPLYMHPLEFGRYNYVAKQWDDVMCANKEFQIVKSVGNARDDFKKNGYPEYPQVNLLDGYDLLEGAGTSKNVLVVGAVNLESPALLTNGYYDGAFSEPYSSWGPTDDGRIKPDLVTHGKSVFSSIETQNNSYGTYSGTSQAAAGVAGGINLLSQYWNSRFPSVMWSSTIRALLIHSIDEIDDRGPDYRNGWGLVNLEKAATIVQNRGYNVIIREDVITNGQTIRLNLAATGLEDLVVTLAWTDPSGVVTTVDPNIANTFINETNPKLVNDLDIRLIRNNASGIEDTTLTDPLIPLSSLNSNNVLYPWKMKQQIAGNNTAALASRAIRGNNDRDNVEKIEVYQNFIPATGGMFQLEIKHKGTIADPCDNINGQKFSLIVSGVSFCEDNLVFKQNQDNELTDNTGTLVLASTIKGSNIIRAISPFQMVNPDFVEYQAKDFIELLPQANNGGTGTEGFTSELGSDFLAHIDCTSDMNERMAFSPREIESIIKDEIVDDRINVEKGEMVVFPNPLINDILHIQFSLLESSALTVEVYDVSGKLIFSDDSPKIYEVGVNKKTLDLNRLPSGTYILKTKTNDGYRQIKFIKK